MKFLRKLGIPAMLIGLAAVSWWLAELSVEEQPKFDGAQRHDPDFIVEDFHSTVMSETGQPQYELRAARLVHYGDDDSSEIEQPHFIQHTPGAAPLHASARRGFVPHGTPYIKLTGDVLVAQGRDPQGNGSAGGSIRAQELTFKLDQSH